MVMKPWTHPALMVFMIWQEMCGSGREMSMKTNTTVICGVVAKKTTGIIYESGLVTALDPAITAPMWVFVVRGVGDRLENR
jgi:hypothetical protein